MKYAPVFTLLLMLIFCTSCEGQNKTNPAEENLKSEARDPGTSPGSDENFHTQYAYTDSFGRHLIIQNSFPKGERYTDPNRKEYFKSIIWTRIVNETDSPLELTIDFSGDSYPFPSSVGSSVNNYRKIILPSDTMTHDKDSLPNYGFTNSDFLNASIDKPSSLKRTINPKESSGFYVVMLLLKPESDLQKVKTSGASTRAGFSLKGQDLFYTVNGKEIPCGQINLKNLSFTSLTKR